MEQRGALLILLFSFLSPSGAALDLTVPPSHRARVGSDTSIPCTFRLDRRSVDPKLLTISWYFQDREILRFPGTVGAPNPRLSLNKDTTKDGVASLSLTGVRISDGGLYKCSVGHGFERSEKEIRLDIQAPPSINITDNAVIKDKESALRATITGFYPVDIDIKWLREGEILAGGTELPPQRNADGTYRVTSTVTIVPTEGNRNQNFYCRVHHESLSAPLQEGFKLLYGAAPSVSISNKPFQRDLEQTLTCRAWGFYPESIAVSWFLNGTFVEQSQTRRISGSEVASSFRFTPRAEHTGMELLCMVEHGTLKEPSINKLLVEFPDLRVKGLVRLAMVTLAIGYALLLFITLYHTEQHKRKPKVRNIICSEEGEFSLEVENVSSNPIEISWHVAQPATTTNYKPLKSSPLMSENQNGTFHVTNTCEHLRDKIKPEESFSLRATVSHEQLKQPVYKEWKGTDFMKYSMCEPMIGGISQQIFYPNKEATIQCLISNYFPDSLTVSWYRKEVGREGLVQVTEGGRYKILNTVLQKEKDKTLTCMASLVFTPSLSGDEGAEFICEVMHPSLGKAIKENTGLIHVWAKPQVIQPIKLSISASGEVLCSLFVQNFYPKNISITWSCKPVGYKVPKQGERYENNEDSTYNMESTYTIPGNWLKEPSFKVKVTWKHVSMEDPESREMSLKHPDFPWRPTIEEISRFIWIRDQPTNLRCKVSPYFPDALTVSWMEKRKGRDPQVIPVSKYGKYQIPDMAPERRNDNTYTYTAQLSLPPSSRVEEDLEFICRVEHPSLERPIERSTGTRQFKAAPKQPIPVQWSLSDTGEALCTLSLQNFYPKPIELTWTCLTGSQQRNLHSEPQYQNNSDQTFNVTSSCSVPENLLRLPDCKFCVTWNHPATGASESSEISPRDPGFPWRPQVAVQPIPTLTQGREATLRWDISDYFPNALTVTWALRKTGHEELISPPHTQNYRAENKPGRAPCGTYISTEYFPFIPSILSHQGAEIVCRVAHPSLAQPIEIGTGALQITDFPWRPVMAEILTPDLYVGTEAEILCPISGYFPDKLTVTWYKEKESGREELVNNGGRYKIPDIQSQEQADRTLTCTARLAFSPSLSEEHGAEFICRVAHPSLGEAIERRTAPLYVRAAPKQPIPVQWSLSDTGEALCTLSLQNFYPKPIELTWTCLTGSQQTNLHSEPQYQNNSDQTFNVTSSCSVPENLLRLPDCKIHVTWNHPAMGASESREICPRDPGFPWRPQVAVQPIPTLTQGREATLQWDISGYFPNALTVTWALRKIGHEEPISPPHTQNYWAENKPGRAPCGTYISTEYLHFIPSILSHQGAEIVCRVAHPSLAQPIEIGTGALQITAAPKQPIPVQWSLSDTGEALCTLSLQNFYPKPIELTWTCLTGSQQTNLHSEPQYQNNSDRTFNVTSSCSVPENLLRLPDCKIHVTWNHPAMGASESSEICPRDPGFPWRPQVAVQPIPTLTQGRVATLRWDISGYFPNALTVTWALRKTGHEEPISPPHTQNYRAENKPERAPCGTYISTEYLHFIPSILSH
uniref:Ig-like domain-containing protein n=1 Tax=Xenopus tropicalis TaxID=8364 RepID=A0A6I8SEQ2_XENTR